ncbi:hypothetical protein FIBSPDRAFT_1038514 [Athelia psychrophila]|uniref:Uncharacterized protein n=1 Tax=Athelia psychrophila TaxID=1759441 RepID=A0A166T4F3_9AGAM|nr:hypothetical protein FIBSPDRAFT_1038514 [Fibularhizoctonia sp. CBS 109695]
MPLYRALMFGSALSWSLLTVQGQGQGNITCKDTSLDWYTSVVGETPCESYQSLRRVCNSAYTAPNISALISPTSPGVQCNDQDWPGVSSDCCCNSIAFGLGVLCINCQLGTGSENGHNEYPGAYQTYLNGCSPVTNQGLSGPIQNLVCSNNLKIADELYSLFWSNGTWIYEDAREAIQQNFVANGNNSFTHCPSTTINTTSSLPAQPSSTNTSTAKHSSLSGGAIGGIAIAVVAGLAFAGFLVWFCFGRHRASADAIHHADSRAMGEVDRHIDPFFTQPSDVTPALVSDAPTSGTSPTLASRHMASGKGPVVMAWNRGSSEVRATSTIVTPPPPPTVEPTPSEPERHLDAGRLGRSPSGRLPPAYGEQNA